MGERGAGSADARLRALLRNLTDMEEKYSVRSSSLEELVEFLSVERAWARFLEESRVDFEAWAKILEEFKKLCGTALEPPRPEAKRRPLE